MPFECSRRSVRPRTSVHASRRRPPGAAALLLPALLLLLAASPAQAGWKTSIVSLAGSYPAIAVSSSGVPHMAWLDDGNPADFRLGHAWLDGPTGHVELVEIGDVGWYASIAVDAKDRVHIAYHADHPIPSLRYALFENGTWTTTMVEDGGFSTSIAVDANGLPHIAHIGGFGANEVRYAHFDGANWNFETVASVPFHDGGTSIVLDPVAGATIAFTDTGLPRKVQLAVRDQGAWPVTEVAEGRSPSLAQDAAGRLHVAFNDEAGQALRYGVFDGVSWDFETLASGPIDSPSLALDPGGLPRIAFGVTEDGVQSLRFAEFDGAQWSETIVGGRSAGIANALALDPLGLPHVFTRRTAPGSGSMVYTVLKKAEISADWSALSTTAVPRGWKISGALEIDNDGTDTARRFRLALYLSDDDVLDASDVKVGKTRKIPAISPGEDRLVDVSVRTSDPPSGKRLLAVLTAKDPSDEVDPTNNTESAVVP